MAQWLYNAKIPRHVIADIGGWSLSQRDAMDGYHCTEPKDKLKTLSNLHLSVPAFIDPRLPPAYRPDLTRYMEG